MASCVTNGSSVSATGIIRRGRRAGRSEIDIASLVDDRTGVLDPRIYDDPQFPGKTNNVYCEMAARGLYRRWAELLSVED